METAEPGGDAQSLNDIQSYLANFNKEIGGGQTFILSTVDGSVVSSGEQLYTDATIYQAQGSEDTKMKIEGQSAQQIDPSMIAQPVGMVPTSIQPGTGAIFIQHPAGDGGMQVLASTAQASLAAAQAQTLHTSAQPQEGQLVSVQSGPDGAQHQLVAIQRQPVHQPQMIAMQTTQNPDGMVTVEENPSQVIAVERDQGQTPPQQVSVAQTTPQGHTIQTSDGQSLVLGAGNSYQTVTIVPSEVNQGGEVSYVLIVSQPDADQEKDDNVDMSVYDFKEEARGFEEDYDEDSPRKAIRATTKKPGGGTSTQLMCNYCNYTSPKRYLLTRHMKTHSEERPHKCHLCDRGFKTVASLQNHVNTHTGVRPHKCKECDAAFTTSGELVRHVRYRHTFEKPHKCTECDYASVELSKLKRHIRSHTGERPYQCPHCSYASPDTYKLKRHLRIHTGEKPYECDICHTRFTQSNSLKAHKLIHTGNKPVFQCELCPTTCGRKTDLKIHVQKLHTSDRPLQCKKCGKSFPDRYTYKIHVKTHDGEKCFRCELCPYAALSQRHLESHILTHTGEKPFQCDECEQSFRQKQLLKRHKNLYHTPDYVPPAPREKVHQCTECQKTFAHRGNLLRHMLTHDPDNPEYLAAIKQEDLEGSELESEEESGEEDGIEEGEIVQGTEGIHMANINGQQVQVQLVSVGDQDHPQVYIQIGDEQVGMVQAEEVEPGEPDETVEQEEGVVEETDALEELQPPGTPETEEAEQKGLKSEGDLEEGEVAYDLPKTPTRGRGRPPKSQSPKGMSTKTAEEDGDIEEGEMDDEMASSRPVRRNSKKRGGDSVDTMPVKRTKRVTPKKNDGTDDQKKKDIETCFGFGLDDDEIPPGEN